MVLKHKQTYKMAKWNLMGLKWCKTNKTLLQSKYYLKQSEEPGKNDKLDKGKLTVQKGSEHMVANKQKLLWSRNPRDHARHPNKFNPTYRPERPTISSCLKKKKGSKLLKDMSSNKPKKMFSIHTKFQTKFPQSSIWGSI